MKRLLISLLALLLLIPVAVGLTQENGEAIISPSLEITGIDPSDTPTVRILSNIYDTLGQPVRDLQPGDFTLGGELANIAEVVSVQNITNDDLPLAAVLVLDTSSSMADAPLAAAKDAARVFVNSLREEDSVAIVRFDSTARVVQEYTTDKDVLLTAINNLGAGGRTALYDAGVLGVHTAANSPFSRHAVILLSDGAEYGGASSNIREEALRVARLEGVPVYTIGLGYGIDRTYLQELSAGTNARNYESPTPGELTQIYSEISNLLRSQYIITLNVDVPLDGTEYDFTLAANTMEGATNEASGTFITPIPVPIVELSSLPDGPVSEVTTVSASIKADQEINSVSAGFGDDFPTIIQEPYTVVIDPVTFAPGNYTVTVSAEDTDGDIGSASASFDVAALPSELTVVPDLTGMEISEPVIVTLGASGQTPAETITVTLGDETFELTEQPFNFTIDPTLLQPGEQTVSIDVTNTGGVTSTTEQTFTIAALPSVFSISGIAAGQTFEGSFMPGDVVSASVDVTESQTDIAEVTFTIGDVTVTRTEAPFSADFDLLELGSGTKTLDIAVTNTGGQTSTESVNFTVNVIPTPTPTFTPTYTPTATFTPSSTPTPTVDFQATSDAESTAAAIAAMEMQMTSDAVATADAITTAAAVQTLDAAATSDAVATGEAQGTQDAQATVEAREAQSLGATQTVEAEESGNEQATLDAQATNDAMNDSATLTAESEDAANEQATQNAQATLDAQSALDAAATMTADAQNMADEQATLDAAATLTAEAEEMSDEQATQNAQATLDAQATNDAAATLTAEAEDAANEQATLDAQSTLDAQATSDADATLTAEAGEESTNVARAANLQATADAEGTSTQEAINEQATADASGTEVVTPEDSEPTATLTVVPTTVPTDTAEPTEEATVEEEPTATIDVSNTPVASPTPIGELTEQRVGDEPEGEETDLLPFAVVGCGLLFIVALIVFFALRRRGGSQR